MVLVIDKTSIVRVEVHHIVIGAIVLVRCPRLSMTMLARGIKYVSNMRAGRASGSQRTPD
jgi:hypothetical protein